MEKLALWIFRGYLGEIESGDVKVEKFSRTFVFHEQCCVRVSASNFQVLTRQSSGARAIESSTDFFGGPSSYVLYV